MLAQAPAGRLAASPLSCSRSGHAGPSGLVKTPPHSRQLRSAATASRSRRSVLQLVVASGIAGRGDLRVSAVEAAEYSRVSGAVQQEAPQQSLGPPIRVLATGRIVASEWLPAARCPCSSARGARARCPRGPAAGAPLCNSCRPALAVGDLHGDLQKTLDCLELAGVLAEDDGHVKWVGGDTVVVQLGDVLDRGDSEICESPASSPACRAPTSAAAADAAATCVRASSAPRSALRSQLLCCS